jgi:hypothetical protein
VIAGERKKERKKDRKSVAKRIEPSIESDKAGKMPKFCHRLKTVESIGRSPIHQERTVTNFFFTLILK